MRTVSTSSVLTPVNVITDITEITVTMLTNVNLEFTYAINMPIVQIPSAHTNALVRLVSMTTEILARM